MAQVRVGPTLKRIVEEYGDKVQIAFRDFPLEMHQQAQIASEAAQCAHEQGKFWDFHDEIFKNQRALSAENLKSYAANLSLDTEKFNACVDSGTPPGTVL